MSRGRAVPWTREHTLIALNLYGKLPFGTLHHGNPMIVQVAERMGRTPSSLAMKLSNLASLDPVQRRRGIRGLRGASRADRRMWDEFRANIGVLGPESEQLLHDLFTSDDDQEVDFLRRDGVHLDRSLVRQATFSGATEGTASVTVRRGQQFFRQSVLNAYGVQCCVSGLNVPELLIASHIRPWASSPDTRLDPSNGLCLSRLHDGAFDLGLITLDERYRLVLSRRLKEYLPQDSINDNFVRYEGRCVAMPKLIALPDQRHLGYHREHVFVD